MQKISKHVWGLPTALALLMLASLSTTSTAALTGDILFVVDESGSMSGEHAWLSSMVTSLETQLNAAGVTGNRYGLVGFGASSSSPHAVSGHKHLLGGLDFGSAAQLSTATSGLVLTGNTEDGWQAIDFALNNYTFRPDAALNIVLITDEDRDNTNNALTYAGVLSSLQAKSALLNAVVNGTFRTSTSATSLGHDSEGNAFLADGFGGFTEVAAGTATSTAGSTIANYYNMALASGGAAWDINQLRAGGLVAQSFTEAFVSIKVQEIQTQPPVIPEPGTGLIGIALMGVIGTRSLGRRRSSLQTAPSV